MGEWTFFSNYGHVLVCLARNRDARLRDVAREVGLTERAVQKIVRDLQKAGYLAVTKQGRCNRYRINRRKALRHALESHCTVGKLLALVARPGHPAEHAETEPSVTTAGPPGEEAMPGEDRKPADRKPDNKPDNNKPPPDSREQGSLF